MDAPLLHLPLRFPATSGHLLTTWTTITIHLPSLLPHFSSASLSAAAPEARDEDDEDGSDGDVGVGTSDVKPNTPYTRRSKAGIEGPIRQAQVPSGTYSHVSYVKVYATCRLRRIWFSDSGPGPSQNLPWEFQLYGTKD